MNKKGFIDYEFTTFGDKKEKILVNDSTGLSFDITYINNEYNNENIINSPIGKLEIHVIDNSKSKLKSTNMQGAIDEVYKIL